MFKFKTAGKELTTFSPRTREPAPSSFQLSFNYFVSNKFDRPVDMDWKMLGSVDMLIWADVAPKACEILRRYAENNYSFTVGHMVEDKNKANSRMVFCSSKRTGVSGSQLAEIRRLSVEERKVEKQSGLYYGPDSVLLTLGVSGPKLTILSKMGQALSGEQPNKPAECTTDELPGIVVGRVL